MGYQLIIGGQQSVPLASTQGWRDVKSWVETIDESEYPQIVQLAEHGLSQDLPGLQEELDASLIHESPDESVVDTLKGIMSSLSARQKDAESAFVSDGFSDETESSDDEWSTSYNG